MSGPPGDLADWTATELVAGYARGEVSPVEATEAVLARIAARDGDLNAFCLVDGDGALDSARRSAQRWHAGEPAGPVDGVPTSIKDLMLTRGWPTLRGSRTIDADQEWAQDAPAVARLRESGAVLVGKTTTPELGWKGVTDSPLTGVTRNPWNPDRTSGGSSGGAAAAVAAGMGALATGSDGGGSIRIPAAFCGVVGVKATYGRVPIHPASPFGTLSHAGPLARTVDDAALMLDVLSGPDPRDWSALPPPTGSFREHLDDGVAGLRVGFSPTLGHVDVDAGVAAAVRAAVEVLAGLGAQVTEVDPDLAGAEGAFQVLWFCGAAKAVDSVPPERRALLDPGLREVVEAGRAFSVSDYLDATAQRAALGAAAGRFHERFDLLVTPTLPITAFAAGVEVPPGWAAPRWTSWTPFTYPFNLTQQPAASVPCGRAADGLPVGLQIVGPRHADRLVLAAAKAYQDARSVG